MSLLEQAARITRRAVRRARKRRQATARFSLVALVMLGLIASGANAAQASAALATQTINGLASATATRNEVLNLKVQTPVADPGSTTQSITQWIDPLRYQIKSAADIIAPAGWVLTYSYDGSTFVATAPTTAAQWASVKGVRATGSLTSEGTENGKQIAAGQASATSSPDGVFKGSSSAGDGFDVIFDDSGHVFNIYHGGNGIDCHFRTGEACPGAWPKLFNNPATNTQVYFTNLKSTGWYDAQDKELWMNTVNATQLGFLCLNVADVSAASIYCDREGDGQTADDYLEAFIPVRTQAAGCYYLNSWIENRYECEAGLVATGGKLFTWDSKNGDLLCVDVRAAGGLGAPCSSAGVVTSGVIDLGTNIPHAYSGATSVGAVADLNTTPELVNNGSLVYALSGYNYISCVDASTMSWCPGFAADGSKQLSTSTTLSTFGINIPNASGTIVATCAASGATVECFNPDGTTATSSYPTKFAAAFKATWLTASTTLRDSPVTGGSKVYWNNSAYLYCWDFSTDAQCTNFWQIYKYKVYAVNIDPKGPSCVWSNGDDGIIAAWNTATGTNGCTTNVTVFAPAAFIPRMGCSSSGAILGWRSFQLTAPAAGSYTNASLTVTGADGQPVAGWTNIPLNSGTRTVNLSSLSLAQTGQMPRFLVTINGQTDAVSTAKISVLGESPELCVTPKTVLCPVAALGQLDPNVVLPAETVQVRSEGSSSDGFTTVNMTPGSASLTLPAQNAADCTAILSGKAIVKGSTTPVAGAIAHLLDSSGNAVLDSSGNPITVTTAADGTYSFGALVFGNYKVSFDKTSTLMAATGTTVSGATGTTTGTVTASNFDSVTANTVALSAGVNGVVDAAYATPAAIAVPDRLSGVAGTPLTMNVVANDLVPAGSNLTIDPTSVRICRLGETAPNCSRITDQGTIGWGTYTVNTTTGMITFTPSSSARTGAEAPVTYVATLSDGTKISSTFTPVYVTLTADSTMGVMNTVQTKNVLTNDTGMTYVASTIKLCDPTTTPAQVAPNCTVAPGTTLTVPNVGTYVVDAAGLVTFTPVSGYVGTAPALGYQVSDASGLTVGSTYTVAVIGARPDVTSGPQGVAQNSNLYTNDTLLSGAQNFKLCDPTTNPAQTAPNCNATAVTVAGVGSYTLNMIGAVTFTPEPSFLGTAPALGYQTTDTSGRTVSSTYTPSVYAAPTAVADISSGPMNTAQTKNLLTNDNAVSSSVLLGSTLKLCDPTTTPAQTPNSCTATSVTVPNVGTYSVDANGLVTFTPVTGYSGTPTALKYQVSDAVGQTANSTYTPTIIPGPTANPETSSGPLNTVQLKLVTTNDVAGAGTTIDVSSVKLCDPTTTPAQVSPNCTVAPGSTLTISGVGTYSVSSLGLITFTPETGFTGTAPALNYQVSDALGQVATSTYTPSVYGAPSATANSTSGLINQPQTVNLVSNDSAGTGTTLDVASVKLCDSTLLQPLTACTATTLVVSDVGTYTVSNTGVVTFTPVTGYTGTPTPVSYQVYDSMGQKATATYSPTVIGVPVASPNATSGPLNTDQTSNLVTNDAAAAGTTLVASSVKLCDISASPAESAPNCTVGSSSSTGVVVPNVGTYKVDSSGIITFTPVNGYTGTPTALPYQIADNLSQVANSTYTPTVIPPPTATPNTTTGAKNQTQTINIVVDDSAATGTTLVASSVRLCDPATSPAEVAPNCSIAPGATLTVANVGTYAVTSAGQITFTPVNGYTGTPAALNYQVSDALGQVATSTYTPSVFDISVATADVTSGPLNTPQSATVLGNDTAGALLTLDATSVKLCSGSQVAPNCTATSVTVQNVGTYVVNQSTGVVTFTPVTGYTGTPTALGYQVTDSQGQVANSTYTPTVYGAPTASPNSTTGGLDQNQTANLVTNDTAGAGTVLDPSTVKLCDPTTFPAQQPNNCAATTVTIAGVGTYSVDSNGVVTFDPEPTYTGTPTALKYQVTDDKGQVANSTYTPTVIGLPTAVPNATSGPLNTAQTTNILTNDSAASGTTLTASTVKLCDPAVPETSPNCSVAPGSTITVANVGTYSVTATGDITFTPVTGYTGTPAPLNYQVSDALGQKATSTYTPTVYGAPIATSNSTTGAMNTPQSVNVTTNDTAGAGTILDATTVKLCSAGQTAPNCSATSITVPNVGTYTVASTGVVTFTPTATYTGTPAGVTYQVSDNKGQAASSTYLPSVYGVPAATANTTSGAHDVNQTVSLVANDSAGVGTTLDVSSVKLCDPTTTPAQSSPNCTATTVTVPNVGTYTVDSSGQLTFDPLSTFNGTPTPLAYQVSDNKGQVANSTYTPTVIALPTATPNTTIGPLNTAQTTNILTNDAAASGTTLTLSTVKLCDPAVPETSPNCTVAPGSTITVANVGTYSVTATGDITFTPVTGYTGTPAPLNYQVSDALGQTATSTYTPTVYGAPTASPNTTIGPLDQNQVVNLLTNDTAGVGTSFDVASVKLCATGQTPPGCNATSVTVPNVGTYTLDASGVMTFDPLPTYTGTPAAVTYQVTDNKGQVASSTYTPTVYGAPTAAPNTTSGPLNAVQTQNIVTNDTAGAGTAFDLTTLKLCAPSGSTVSSNPVLSPNGPNCIVAAGDTITVPSVGTYSVDAAGLITFTPETGYVGTPAPLTYSLTDNKGQTVTSTYTPTVIGAPTATLNTTSGPQNTPQSVNILTNDAAATGTTLVASTVLLCDPNTNPAQTSPNCTVAPGSTITVANVGTYSVTAAGVITFTPVTGYIGTPPALNYQVSDALGQKATSTYTPTVYAGPTANPDTTIGPLNTPQTKPLLTNDVPASASTLVTSTIRLCAANETVPTCSATTVTVPNVGTYAVNTSTGVVTFTPVTGYTGTPAALPYTVADTNGMVGYSTYTPTVYGAPVANPNTTSGPMNTAQSTNIFTNDVAGALTTLDVTTIKLCDPTTSPAQTPDNCAATTVTVPNVGTYVLDATTGVITFTPVTGYTGTPAPLKYQVTDNKGQTANSTYTPTIIPPPAVTPDAQTTAWNTAQSYTPLSNDHAASGTTLVAASITLCDPNSNPAQASPNCTIAAGTPIVVANEGTYLLLNSGVVTFTPLSTFVGTATGIHYTVTDALGQVSTTTITPTILPIVPPVANPDRYSTFPMTPITVNPVVNDVRGSGVLVASTVLLCSPTETAPTCSSTTAQVDQGVFTVQPDGHVTFTPNERFEATHSVVIPYIILDANGLSTHSTITIDDPPLPVIIPQLVNTGLNILGSVPAAVVLIAIGFGFAAVGVKSRKKAQLAAGGSLKASGAFASFEATLERVSSYKSPVAFVEPAEILAEPVAEDSVNWNPDA